MTFGQKNKSKSKLCKECIEIKKKKKPYYEKKAKDLWEWDVGDPIGSISNKQKVDP